MTVKPAEESALMPLWATGLAGALAVLTVVHLGVTVNAILWGLVQVVLVGIAAYDISTRLVKNIVTVPVSLLCLLLRLIFERAALAEVVVSGVVVLLTFTGFALVTHGGFGFGDVKLAGMLGFLLGSEVLAALAIGALAGGVAAALILVRARSRHATLAYGPYLALGGVLTILFLAPPNLV